MYHCRLYLLILCLIARNWPYPLCILTQWIKGSCIYYRDRPIGHIEVLWVRIIFVGDQSIINWLIAPKAYEYPKCTTALYSIGGHTWSTSGASFTFYFGRDKKWGITSNNSREANCWNKPAANNAVSIKVFWCILYVLNNS